MAKNMGQSMHGVWPTILTALSQLAIAEKSYASFLYLSPKWFGRRDVSDDTYISYTLGVIK